MYLKKCTCFWTELSVLYIVIKNWYKTFLYVSRNLSPEWLRKEKHVNGMNGKIRVGETREEAVRVQRPSDPAEYSRLMKQSKCMISGISQAKLSSLSYSYPPFSPEQSYTPLSWSLCWNNDLNSTHQQYSHYNANFIYGRRRLNFKCTHPNELCDIKKTIRMKLNIRRERSCKPFHFFTRWAIFAL